MRAVLFAARRSKSSQRSPPLYDGAFMPRCYENSPLLNLNLLSVDMQLDHLLGLLWRLRRLSGDCRGRKGRSGGARRERHSSLERGTGGARRSRSPQHHCVRNSVACAMPDMKWSCSYNSHTLGARHLARSMAMIKIRSRRNRDGKNGFTQLTSKITNIEKPTNRAVRAHKQPIT